MIAEIEDAIIKTLKEASALGYLRVVASYGGELDDEIGEVIRALPAVWVVFGGSDKPEKLGAEKWKVPCKFVTMVAARSVRNEAATRKGDALNVGTYEMINHVRTLLLNNDFGMAIERLQPGRVQTMYNTKVRGQALSVFSIEWQTAYMLRMPELEAQDLLKFGINYYLQPNDDNVADLTQKLNLNI